MSRPTVYLAGPILYHRFDQANNWRTHVARQLEDCGLRGISPLRDEPLVGDSYGSVVSDDPRLCGPGLLEKNLFDLRTCSLVLAYLPTPLPGRHQSFGTLGEVFAAKALSKPVVLVTTDPDVQAHSVLLACAGWVTDNLPQGVSIAIGLLGQYAKG